MAKQMTVLDFATRKTGECKISMVTCYDFWTASLLNQADVDCLLVGDSLAMVMHGHESTVHADVELMALHTRAVVRGAPDKFIVSDMPFLSVRKGLGPAMDAVQSLIQSGADAIKIEGEAGHLDLIRHVVESGVPVMGHLGLTPQAVLGLGGHRVQGREERAARALIASATRLVEAGCFAIVLECVPSCLGAAVTRAVPIATIGIGAGPETDGQVLVLQDLLGTNPGFKPRFLRHYVEGYEVIRGAVDRFHQDVQAGTFPSPQESYA